MTSASNDLLMKQRSVIEFLSAEGCSAVVIHKRMKAVYGDACLTEGKVRKGARFYRGEDPRETTVRDRKSPGRPVSASDTTHQTIFWDMEGIVRIVFLEQGTTVNSERYVSTLRALKGRLRRVRQDKVKDVVIQHDNARPHTSRQTQCALQQLELPTIPHPPYSPDLALSDFFYCLC